MSTFIPIKTAEQLATYVPQLGPLQVRNPHICDMKEDVLYHIALGNKTHDLKDMFKDVKFVCFGGSPNRMQSFAKYMIKVLNYKLPAGQDLCDIAHGSDRYVLYKVGPVLSVSEVAQELLSMADPENDFTTIIGKTMSTLDFYEGWLAIVSARLDNAEAQSHSHDHDL
nr:hypothetical protein BaRGS_005234 [Batillaria attramentaria]